MQKRLPNIHPGEIIKEEFLIPLNITQYALALGTGIPHSRITRIIQGQCRITVDTAIRLGLFFKMSTQFWLNLQMSYDIMEAQAVASSYREKVRPFDWPTAKLRGKTHAKKRTKGAKNICV